MSYVLLGQPWIEELVADYNEEKNAYTFSNEHQCLTLISANPLEKIQPKVVYSISEHSSRMQSEDDPKQLTNLTQRFHKHLEAIKEIQHVDFVNPPSFNGTNEKIGILLQMFQF